MLKRVIKLEEVQFPVRVPVNSIPDNSDTVSVGATARNGFSALVRDYKRRFHEWQNSTLFRREPQQQAPPQLSFDNVSQPRDSTTFILLNCHSQLLK
jgi:hypothetical protein